MVVRRILCTAFLSFVCLSSAWAQGFRWGWAQAAASNVCPAPALSPSQTISLTVPKGTTLHVALDKEVRVKRVGQPVHGHLVEPVYAFNRQVIPVGSEVVGRITEIEGVSGKKRFLAALNVDFTPTRKIHVEFDQIILADGKHIPIRTVVTPGSGRAVRLITTVDNDQSKPVKDAASERMKEAIREAKRRWHAAVKQVKEPGRMRRLVRFAAAQLPVHPQYINAGTVYFAEMKEPLDFGSQPLTPQMVTSISTPPPCSLLAHAQLVTPLSSATTQRDAPVEAVLSRPAFSGDRFIFPQGSRLKGSVVQVQPARRLGRNGKVRFAFHELVLPSGIQQKVDAYLQGVLASKGVKLDVEGGAQATSPKTRYLSTGVTVALAVASHDDTDTGVASESAEAKEGVAGGAAGFKLVGILVGAFARSRPLALGMGIFGASRSAYSHFLGRGRDVVFPKGTTMEIGLWLTRDCDDSVKPD